MNDTALKKNQKKHPNNSHCKDKIIIAKKEGFVKHLDKHTNVIVIIRPHSPSTSA